MPGCRPLGLWMVLCLAGCTAGDDGGKKDTGDTGGGSSPFPECGLPEPCPEFDDAALWQTGGFEEARCLLDALVAQDPARLKYVHDEGDTVARWDLSIGYADGLVREHKTGFKNGCKRGYAYTYVCELKSPEYFTACIESEDVDCVYPSNWVDNCNSEADPTCP